jgi:hypothetical protein
MPPKKTEAAATKPAAPKRTRAKKAPMQALMHDVIAERAYFLHLERGGDQVENWLHAERELAPA